jgi:type II secretory pathway component HofQ
VITRRQGDKVISRHPYTLTVDADGPRANLRLGAQIPVSSTTGDGKLTSYNYKDVGTVIDCSAKTLDGGRYRLDLALTDNEVLADDASGATKGLPQFGSFSLGNVVAVLKDGQTTQLTTAAEKATGAVIAVDVTMNIVK